MLRLLAVLVVGLIANALGLIVGDLTLSSMSMTAEGFLIALVLFTGADILFQPLIRQTAVTRAPALIGSTALVSTLIALIVTAAVTDSLSIDGLGTWVLATVIVWVVSLVAHLLLPFVIFKKTLARAKAGGPAA